MAADQFVILKASVRVPNNELNRGTNSVVYGILIIFFSTNYNLKSFLSCEATY